MFEETFKNIDDVLHKDAGCGSELDYGEQSSWVLFLKYLDDLEKDRESSATLSGKAYEPILRDEYRWGVWAMPRTATGEIDHHVALTGDDLIEFVLSRYIETGVEVLDRELLPELLKLKYEAIEDAMAILGDGAVIAKTFTEFQKHLYSALSA